MRIKYQDQIELAHGKVVGRVRARPEYYVTKKGSRFAILLVAVSRPNMEHHKLTIVKAIVLGNKFLKATETMVVGEKLFLAGRLVSSKGASGLVLFPSTIRSVVDAVSDTRRYAERHPGFSEGETVTEETEHEEIIGGLQTLSAEERGNTFLGSDELDIGPSD